MSSENDSEIAEVAIASSEHVKAGNNQKLPVLSLFCGLGALDIGFEEAGFLPELALDIDQAAVDTYNWNRPDYDFPARTVDLSDIDPETIISWWQDRVGEKRPIGIIGGPPCQAFSVGNVRKLKDDPRAKLPLEYARILSTFNNKYSVDFFLFENVKGLGNSQHESSLTAFIDAFSAAGFNIKQFYLDAVEFQVPQYRNRMFIVGFNKERYDASKFIPPVGDPTLVTVRQAIENLPEPLYFSKKVKSIGKGLHPNHWCMTPRSEKFRNGTLTSGKMQGRSFRRLAWDSPSWTASYGHREVHVHPNGHRRLSVYEAMLIQSIPKNYELRGNLSEQIKLVSDAVPPPVANAIAKTIRLYISGVHDERSVNEQPGDNRQIEHRGLTDVQIIAPKSTRA